MLMINTASSYSSKHSHRRHHNHHHHRASAAATATCNGEQPGGTRRLTTADDDGELDNGRAEIASTESLDSIVERILENAAATGSESDSERRQRRRQTARVASSEVERLDRSHPTNQHRLTETRDTATEKEEQRRRQSGVNGRRRKQRRPAEKTLEDLFEEAVESLRDDIEHLAEAVPPAPTHHRRLRSAENWERQIFDSELHDQCRHYRLQTYTNRDVSRVSRGFVLVQRRDKKLTSDVEDHVEQQRGPSTSKEAGDVAYLQWTVTSARAGSSDAGQAVEDGIDLGLDAELATNRRRGTSQSSSVTWDSVSVDSLVMYEDEETTVQATAVHSAATDRQSDDEFVDKLRRLQDKWQTNSGDSDAVWIPMSRQNNQQDFSRCEFTADAQPTDADHTARNSRQLETTTSPEDGDRASILSDCLTSQRVVINVRLPRPRRSRRSRLTDAEQRQPTVPFRELRLRREIRLADDDATPRSTTTAIIGCADSFASETGDVTSDRKSGALATTTSDDGVMLLTADSVLRDDDLTTSFADATIVYDDRDSTRSMELVPVYDSVGRSTSQPVDVSRSEATRVVRLPSTSSARLLYNTPTLAQTVEYIRRALLSGARRACADGVTVSCEAVETLSRRGDQSAPVVRNIVVDCLPPSRSPDLDHAGNTTSSLCS